MKFLVVFLILTTILTQSQDLDKALLKIQKKYQIVGMSIALVKNKKIIFNKGYGKRDLKRNLFINNQTKYRIASISKMIAATALLQLHEKGHFKLDQDISPFLGFSLRNPQHKQNPITFEMILAHTSSLRDGKGYFDFLRDTARKMPPPKLEELFTSYYSKDMFSTHAPQKNYFTYANINYGIIATLVEKISRERFDHYCQKNIFAPLGMTANFNIFSLPDINDVAVLYRKKGQWVPQADNYKGSYPPKKSYSKYLLGSNGFLFAPQGGLRAGAQELIPFLLAHQNGGSYGSVSILSPKTIALMHKSVWKYQKGNGDPYDGIFQSFALGNHTTSSLLPKQNLTGHPGEAYGLISDMYFGKKFGIVFITNGGVWGKGKFSGWYNVEEEVFAVCFAHLQNQ